MIEGPFQGGCLCGAIRYQVNGPAWQTSYCHCVDCRKASGAPAAAWTFFRSGTLEWLQGHPKILKHADRERSFCGDCGTPLKFYDPSLPDIFEMNTCTLDDPAPHVPADQCWTEDRIPWEVFTIRIPSYLREAPLPDVS